MEEQQQLPPGFRFHPTDEELITCYLSPKVLDLGFVAKAIADVDLNKCEPWDLPAKASMGEKEWYFFSPRDRKYPTGLRTNRATDAGYWKTTGKDKEILCRNVVAGMKKTLVFYRGRAPKGEKTNWVMHEYRLQNKSTPYKPAAQEEWVVCRVFKKSSNAKKPPEPNTPSAAGSPCDTTLWVSEVGELDGRRITNNLAVRGRPGSFNSMQESSSRRDLDLYMDWMSTRGASSSLQPLLPWLGSTFSSTTSPSVLEAMEAANISSLNSLLMGQGAGGGGGGGGDHPMIYGSESKPALNASPSRLVDTLQQQQQQQQQRDHKLVWRGY